MHYVRALVTLIAHATLLTAALAWGARRSEQWRLGLLAVSAAVQLVGWLFLLGGDGFVAAAVAGMILIPALAVALLPLRRARLTWSASTWLARAGVAGLLAPAAIALPLAASLLDDPVARWWVHAAGAAGIASVVGL